MSNKHLLNTNLNSQVYRSFSDLHSGYWDQLKSASIFSDQCWYQNFVATALQPNADLRIYCHEILGASGEMVLAALPLSHIRASNIFAPRRLTALSNFYTSLYSPLISGEDKASTKALSQVIEAFCKEIPAWDVVDLRPLDREAATYRTICDCLRLQGMLIQEYFCFGNWYLVVGGRTFGEYYSDLGSPLRNTIKRKRRSLEKQHQTKFVIVNSEDNLEKAISDYQSVYSRSWKIVEPYPEFMPGLMKVYASQKCLRLGLLYCDEKPIAAQVWLVRNGIASIFKLAYDEGFSHFSPGSLLTATLMEQVIDGDKVEIIDYLTGDDQYKKDWMSNRRERWGIMAFNPHTAKGLLLAVRHLGASKLKCALRMRN